MSDPHASAQPSVPTPPGADTPALGFLAPRQRLPLLRPGYAQPGSGQPGRVIAGVCAGLSLHLGVPVSICRLLMVALSCTGVGLFLYLWLWLFVRAGDPWEAALSRDAAQRTASVRLAAPNNTNAGGNLAGLRQTGPSLGTKNGPTPVNFAPANKEISAARGILSALALLGLALVLFWAGPGRIFNSPWLGPATLMICGFLLILGQITRLDAAWRPPSQWGRSGWLTWGLLTLGIIMLTGGVVFLIGFTGSYLDTLRGALAAIVALAAVAVAFTPLVVRLTRQMSATRAEQALANQRADIAAHLHDGVLQTLTLIRSRADDPKQVAALARAQERELRAWLYTDRPAENTSLAADFKTLAGQIEDLYATPIDVVTVGDTTPGTWSEPLLAATREALANACRHGKPPVSLYVEINNEKAQAFVKDRGPGFDLENIDPQRHGVRHSIIERLERHHGSARIKNSPGGCEIEMEVKHP